MSFLLRFSLLFIFYSLIIAITNVEFVKTNDYPGVIELIGYNTRRQSKMQKLPTLNDNNNNNNNNNHQTSTYITQPMKKQRADIETVKQNIEEYNKLLKIDTKKLSEQQKDMLERIVERVARLKETLDDVNNKQTTINTTPTTTATLTSKTTLFSSTLLNTDHTDSILIQNDDINNDDINSSSIKFITDETTFLPQTTDNIFVTTTQQTTLAGSGGRSALTTTYQQSEEARANLNNKNGNINLSTISSNSRSSIASTNKSKTRHHSTTRKPMSSTKPTSKRIISNSGSSGSSSSSSTSSNNGHHIRPSIKPTFSTNSPPSVPVSITTTTQQTNTGDFGTFTTGQPLQMKQQTNYNKQDIIVSTTDNDDDIETDEKTVSSIEHHLPPVPAVQIQERTPIGGSGGIISTDLIYDSNVTATSIIDSLSNHAREDYYNNNKGSLSDSIKDKKPSTGTAKPTKYHYYPHNQHIYLLPECAIQQVCNAVYVRLNYTQPLCACPSRYRDPCSASLNEDDQHTTKLVGDGKKKAITLAKTCEATTEMRECRSPKDWSLLALQNTRTGKSHYLVICRCPDHFKLEGPMAHDQPTYASVPGIRVFGMMCVKPGYSIRKPSVQPPKRYQLQKPYYISNSHKYTLNKDNNQRPSSSLSSQSSNNGYQQQQQQLSSNGYQNNQQHDSYQLQNQANYQYLNRPESSPIITSGSHTEYPESIAINSFSTNSVNIANGNSGYGRNNERKNDNPIEAEAENENLNSTNDDDEANDEKKRTKRSTKIENIDNNIPEFPWDKLLEFQQKVVWDN